jgi:AAA+ ATPase superfamily predicted ATPase
MLRNALCVMTNPFEYGGIVTGPAFCDRTQEKSDLRRAIANHQKVFVFSERRFGKTSLVRAVMDALPRRQTVAAFVDLWPTDGEAGFATTAAKAIAASMESSADKLLAFSKNFFGSLVPTLTLNEEGKPELSFGINKQVKLERALEDVLETPARIANKREVVIVFDEFQQVLEYKSDLVERKLRSVIQHQPNVGYLFLGSRRHLIQKMFLDKARPLYRAGTHYPLGPIAEKDWRPFIRHHFEATDRSISDGLIQLVYERTQGHPFYTQHLCHAIWELCERKSKVSAGLVEQAAKLLIERENYAYTVLWESLASNQRKFLKGLAQETNKVQVFGSHFTIRYGLGSASNVQRVVESLLDRDIIDRDNGSFLISDRFFRLWVRTL